MAASVLTTFYDIEEFLYDHICIALDQFEAERRIYLDYVYTEHQAADFLIIIFSKSGREDQYYTVCIYGHPDEHNPVRSEQDYFEMICKRLPISPYEQLSHHVVIGEREEGMRYRDNAREIIEAVFSEEDT